MRRKRSTFSVERSFREKTMLFFKIKTWCYTMRLCSFLSCILFFFLVLSYDMYKRVVVEDWRIMFGNYAVYFALGIVTLAFIADTYTSIKFSGKDHNQKSSGEEQ